MMVRCQDRDGYEKPTLEKEKKTNGKRHQGEDGSGHRSVGFEEILITAEWCCIEE